MKSKWSLSLLLPLWAMATAFGQAPETQTPDKPPAATPVATPSAADLEHFEKKIRPLLHANCYSCHAADAKSIKGGLRLDSRHAILTGGDSGPALVPGKPEESLLIDAVRYGSDSFQMPPKGKLPDADIAELVAWVSHGAPFPESTAAVAAANAEIDYEAGRKFWSFQPVQQHPLPAVTKVDWPRGRLDAFVLGAMEKNGLAPSPEASRATLVRRLTFDLTGLPPTPEEVAQFVADPAPDAYEKLVERLLASPHYGERWGRVWLDLARYTDTTPTWLDSTSNAHQYRDWVVKAFNDDLPYDQFVRRQLASDMMSDSQLSDLAALGFLGLSPTYWKELQLPPEIIKVIVADEWEERVDAVSRTFLGLTVACARCHNHKFDPISMEDYYAMAGVFANNRLSEKPMIPESDYEPVRTAKAETTKLAKELEELKKKKPLPETEIAAVTAKIDKIKGDTPNYNAPMANIVTDEALHVVLAGDTPQSGTRLEYKPEPQDLHIFIRGNPNRLGAVVPRRFLKVLASPDAQPFRKGSGRLELAESIVRDAAPLSARVYVNRIWLQHFGRGLVDAPSNFGAGAVASHPELLDDLAARFIAEGWSTKKLHREIVLSATYRQASQHDEKKFQIDPDNRWLWHMNRHRLDVEAWRDAMLACAGQLDRTFGGPSVAIDAAGNRRRTIYCTIDRHEMPKMLQIHDFPDPNSHSPQRIPTSTPLQGLYVLNNGFVAEQAEHLAKRVQADAPQDFAAQVRRAHELLFGRAATNDEIALATAFFQQVGDAARDAAWKQYAHALLGSNEFLFVD